MNMLFVLINGLVMYLPESGNMMLIEVIDTPTYTSSM